MRSLLALALAAPAVAFTPAVAPRKIVRGGRGLSLIHISEPTRPY